MAASTLYKLSIEFATLDGRTLTMNFNYVKPDLGVAYVKALANGIVSNGSIFAKVPAVTKSAKIVTTSEEDYDLSE